MMFTLIPLALASDPLPAPTVKPGGFVETYVAHNFNNPANGVTKLPGFDGQRHVCALPAVRVRRPGHGDLPAGGSAYAWRAAMSAVGLMVLIGLNALCAGRRPRRSPRAAPRNASAKSARNEAISERSTAPSGWRRSPGTGFGVGQAVAWHGWPPASVLPRLLTREGGWFRRRKQDVLGGATATASQVRESRVSTRPCLP
jgi:hypothetical protein